MKKLLKSKKFWLTVTAVTGSAIAAASGGITWSQALAQSTAALVTLVASIAGVDIAEAKKDAP